MFKIDNPEPHFDWKHDAPDLGEIMDLDQKALHQDIRPDIGLISGVRGSEIISRTGQKTLDSIRRIIQIMRHGDRPLTEQELFQLRTQFAFPDSMSEDRIIYIPGSLRINNANFPNRGRSLGGFHKFWIAGDLDIQNVDQSELRGGRQQRAYSPINVRDSYIDGSLVIRDCIAEYYDIDDVEVNGKFVFTRNEAITPRRNKFGVNVDQTIVMPRQLAPSS